MKLKFYAIIFAFIFSQQILPAQYTKLFDFDYTYTGVYPYYSALISDGSYLYGTTQYGGIYSKGTVFKIKMDGSNYETVYDFNDTTGNLPKSSVVLIDGYLYGTANAGGSDMSYGTIFKIKTDGSDFSVLKYFDGDNSGSKPESSLYFDGAFLYGTAVQSGPGGGGTLYKLKTDGSSFSTIIDFIISPENGFAPHGHVISDGTYLYGMTKGGGEGDVGTIYRIKSDRSGYADIFDFIDDLSGAWGYGGLVYNGSEYLYGMTNNGGIENRGTVFKVKTDGSGYEMLLDMNGENGAQPLGSLILVGTTLYGLTELGSPDGDAKGTMYSIETDGSNYTLLIDFDGDNGAYPFGTLFYESGAFFGMTAEGGANNSGVIFQYGDIVKSVNELNVSALNIYPNPAENVLSISIPQTSANEFHVQVINAIGEIVLSEELFTGEQNINITNVPAGFYVVKAYDEKNILSASLIVK